MNKIVIIVAGGTGNRMQSETPKQFMLLQKLPVLMHSMNSFIKSDNNLELRLVLPESELEAWRNLCIEYNFKVKHAVFAGGETRFHSVKNGLEGINAPSIIAIHDGVRPLVSQKTIANCFDLALQQGTAIPVLPVTESIREVIEEDSFAKKRDDYRRVQTPQVFQSDLLLDAYDTEYEEDFTDDASVVEKAGYKIYLAEGNEENIKITTPLDFVIAEALLEYSQKGLSNE